jgi:hypothetical protein
MKPIQPPPGFERQTSIDVSYPHIFKKQNLRGSSTSALSPVPGMEISQHQQQQPQATYPIGPSTFPIQPTASPIAITRPTPPRPVQRTTFSGQSSGKTVVKLIVYDLSRGLMAQQSLAVLGRYIEAVYHSSIEVFGVEYWFSPKGSKPRLQEPSLQ